jgi:hypothetical protein
MLSTNLNMKEFHGANSGYKNCKAFNLIIEEDVERWTGLRMARWRPVAAAR